MRFGYRVYFAHVSVAHVPFSCNHLFSVSLIAVPLAAFYILCVSSFVRNRYRHGHTNVGSGNENASDVFDARDFGGFFTTCIHLHYS